MKEMAQLGVLSRPIYTTLSYQQDNFKSLSSWRWSKFVDYPDYNKVHCDVAEDIAINHFEIPIVPSLTNDEIEKVENVIIEVFG